MRLILMALFILPTIASYSQTIQGRVTAGTDTISQATVLLVHTGPKATVWPIVDTSYTSSEGNYIFDGHPADNYLIKVLKPSNDFMHTYYGNSHRWDSAMLVKVGNDTVQADIELISSANWSGPGRCSGTIIYQSKNKTTGDPVPDVDVVLEQIPGSEAKLSGTTGQDGFYEIGTIKSGIQYDVSLSIPGLEMDSTYRLKVTTTDTVFPDINLSVDTTTGKAIIFITDLSSVPENEQPGDIFRIYPNPGNGIFHIQWIQKGTTPQATVKVYDSHGKLLYDFDKLMAIDLTNQPSGIYYVEINAGDQVIRKQLVIGH